jgi:hypothetical protein
MNRIFKYFQAGLISMALLSGGLVQAEKKDRMFPYPVQEQLEPVTTSLPAPPTAIQYGPTAEQPAPPTAIQYAPSTTNQPAPPTAFRDTAQGDSLPDLFVSEYSLEPSPPSRQSVVDVRVGVYNQGGAASGPFTVQWWPGEDYPKPGCTWRVEGLVPNGGRILNCSGYVYPSWYGRINTVVYVDSDREVQEVSTRNNKLYRETQVTK